MSRTLPLIIVSENDYDALSELSERTARQLPDVSDFLATELERARVLPADQVPADVVTMGSRVAFRMGDTARERTVTLVYPAEADIQQGRLSIMTPVGAALLGLSPGQSMSWEDRMGELRSLTLQAVLSQPAP